MPTKIIAIGLDGADYELINRWCEQGHLPAISGLRSGGARATLTNFDCYRAEIPWTTFLTGVAPEQTGYWGRIRYHADQCAVDEGAGAYQFDEYPPFYALDSEQRVCVFDMPQTRLQIQQAGLEVLAWGAHSPRGPSVSKPTRLFSELVERYGDHPRLNNDHANIYDANAISALYHDFLLAVERRTKIAKDLIHRQNWDLFLMMFSETHSAGHTFWHLDQPHPLNGMLHTDSDYLLQIFKAVDRSIAEILASNPQSTVMLFSVHGMVSNVLDIGSMLMLPEFCYRRYVDKRGALACANDESLRTAYPQHWSRELWQRRNRDTPSIASPFEQEQSGMSLAWQPANWYQPRWPQMRAFALPSYSDGYIRLNVVGRDKHGLVSEAEYHHEIEALEQSLAKLTTVQGKPAVRKVIRTRETACDTNPNLPDADLIICWHEDKSVDTLVHPDLGQFGPAPFFRTGGHNNNGFVFANGQNIQAADLGDFSAVQLTSSLVKMMQQPIPSYMAEPIPFVS